MGERSGLDEWEVISHRNGFMNPERVAFGSGRTIDDARAQAEEAYEREMVNRNR